MDAEEAGQDLVAGVMSRTRILQSILVAALIAGCVTQRAAETAGHFYDRNYEGEYREVWETCQDVFREMDIPLAARSDGNLRSSRQVKGQVSYWLNVRVFQRAEGVRVSSYMDYRFEEGTRFDPVEAAYVLMPRFEMDLAGRLEREAGVHPRQLLERLDESCWRGEMRLGDYVSARFQLERELALRKAAYRERRAEEASSIREAVEQADAARVEGLRGKLERRLDRIDDQSAAFLDVLSVKLKRGSRITAAEGDDGEAASGVRE